MPFPPPFLRKRESIPPVRWPIAHHARAKPPSFPRKREFIPASGIRSGAFDIGRDFVYRSCCHSRFDSPYGFRALKKGAAHIKQGKAVFAAPPC